MCGSKFGDIVYKGDAEMIPSGIPKVTRIVKNGMGGPNKDSIPVKEDLGGGAIGYLKNETQVNIVDPSYPGISKYRKVSNGSTWVVFEDAAGKLFSGLNDIWCEESGHLVEVESEPEEEWVECSYRFEDGRLFLKKI
jgi:hypothetical protein